MRPCRSVTGPLLLILVGVVFLINAVTPDFRLAEVFANYWPYLLIVWGLLQLLEVVIRFGTRGPLPTNGVSGGGWVVVALISAAGFFAYQAHRIDPWWQHGAFVRGIEAFGREHEFSIETVQKPVAAKAPRLVIENFRGDAKIVASSSQTVTLTGRKVIRALEDVEAGRTNAATPVELLVEGDTVIVRSHQDKADSRTSLTTNLEITVPVGTSVEATGTYGDFDISGLGGNIDISSDNAGVRLQDIAGNVNVETRRSDLIRCTDVKGALHLRGHGGDIELNKIGGQVTVNGSYTGSVSLRDLTKPVHVENLHSECDLRQVPGEFRMERGTISMQNVVGPVRLNTRATDVKLEDFTETLDLSIDKGDVELRPGHLPLGRMAVRTRSGNIELEVPQTAGFAISASTDHGEISNDFSGEFREHSKGRGSTLDGMVGSGPDVKLQTDRGSITIRKTSATATPATNATTRADVMAKVN